jgi:hypothetical protein
VFRRRPRRLAPELEAFRAVLAHVQRAGDAMTRAVPTARLPGTPLAEALHAFEEELAAAEAGMPGWRAGELEDVWRVCAAALERARALAERLRLEADAPAGFEALIGTIGDVLSPLDAFDRAAERFREVRRRR